MAGASLTDGGGLDWVRAVYVETSGQMYAKNILEAQMMGLGGGR